MSERFKEEKKIANLLQKEKTEVEERTEVGSVRLVEGGSRRMSGNITSQ